MNGDGKKSKNWMQLPLIPVITAEIKIKNANAAHFSSSTIAYLYQKVLMSSTD